jgi:glycosyltransferase involved in cell wall biosynthesis
VELRVSRAELPISVLLPIHDGVSGRALSQCLESIKGQSAAPAEIVLVEDGPLRADLRAGLDEFASRLGSAVVRVVLDHNSGAGIANDAGLRVASQAWIAKVDADDISLPHRFATQWAAVSTGAVDVCGAAMWEFEGDPANIVGVRRMPRDDAAIRRRLRFNNPINHPTAMYRRDVAIAAGGYGEMRYMQDYDLFARMSVRGARMTNLAEPLVLFRAGDDVIARRRWSPAMADAERTLQANLHRYGVVSQSRACFNYGWRSAYRRLPGRVVGVLHRRWLSRAVSGTQEIKS